MEGIQGGGIPFLKNHGINPAVNFNFMLRVEGLFDLPCKSVRAFQRENEFEYIQEGGLNDYVHMRRKPISKPFTFQVERYVGTDIIDPLTLGTDLILPVILFVNRYLAYGDFLPTRMYTFTGCTVIAKEYGELNAEQSGLMLETTTIAYREMVIVENIISGWVTDDKWHFDGTNKEGTGESNRNNRFRVADVPKADMEAKAQKWAIDKTGDGSAGGFAGANGRIAGSKMYENEVRKEAMEQAAQKWTFDTDGEGKIKNFKGKDGRMSKLPQAEAEVRKADMPHDMWAFDKPAEEDKPADFKGVGGRVNKTKEAQAEIRKKAMEESARLWEFGNKGSEFVARNTNEVRKADMPKDIWTFDKPETGSTEPASFKGVGGRTTATKEARSEVRKSDMEGNATQFKFGDSEGSAVTQKAEQAEASQFKFGGDGSQFVARNADEVRKGNMPNRKWPATRSAVDVAAFLSKK